MVHHGQDRNLTYIPGTTLSGHRVIKVLTQEVVTYIERPPESCLLPRDHRHGCVLQSPPSGKTAGHSHASECPASKENPPSLSERLSAPASARRIHTCFVPPMGSPCTLDQSIDPSSSSSTSPHTTTLSPRTRYSPCSTLLLGSSPAGRIMRSTVDDSTRFVLWSKASRRPTRVRPSVVRMRTFPGAR